jgi:hypothetical protein
MAGSGKNGSGSDARLHSIVTKQPAPFLSKVRERFSHPWAFASGLRLADPISSEGYTLNTRDNVWMLPLAHRGGFVRQVARQSL